MTGSSSCLAIQVDAALDANNVRALSRYVEQALRYLAMKFKSLKIELWGYTQTIRMDKA